MKKEQIADNKEFDKLYSDYKAIQDYEGYLISNKGVIINKFGKKLVASKNQNGFLKICLCKNGKVTTYSIHHLVYKHFKGEYEGELVFIDGNKENCNIDNLISVRELLDFYIKNK